MHNITRHTGTLEILRRLPSSANGNPRYLLRIDGWTCRTAVDSSIAYSIGNYEGKRVAATIGTHYGAATLDSIKLVQEVQTWKFSLETYTQMGERAGRAARQRDHARSDAEFKAASRAISAEASEHQAAAREAFNTAYRAVASPAVENFK